MKVRRKCHVIYIATQVLFLAANAKASFYITPGVLFKAADANSLAALLHAIATVSRRWFKAADKSLAWSSTPLL